MPPNPQVSMLLERILESDLSPEVVCAEHPELLEEVTRRLRQIRQVEAQVEELFPTQSPLPGNNRSSWPLSSDLPNIPGYELRGILGRGGMGVVYEARHLKLNRTIALKTMLAGTYASQVELLRFFREAEAVASLRHPNIVQVHDMGEVDGLPYYTMELVEGGSLADHLDGMLQPPRDAARMIATLARAVEAAHEAGVVHRDLKPANVLLTNDGTLKISDFGLARRLDGQAELTLTGARVGTPAYMAPEQFLNSKAAIGPSVDIHSLGAMLFEMLTGQPPFRGESLVEIERKLMFEEAPPPSRWNPKVPRDLETICLKCLQKDPQRRYLTAGDLAADLERFLRQEPIQARAVGRIERGWRWVRRYPTTAALLFTAAALFALLIGEGVREWTLIAAGRAEKARLTARLESGLRLQRQGRFAEARAILGELGDGGFEDLRQRIDQSIANATVIDELESISIARIAALHDRSIRMSDRAETDRQYESVFERIGVGRVDEEPQVVAQRIDASDLRWALVAALDDWAVCATSAARRNWLLQVARLADPDTGGWRERFRNPDTWSDAQTLNDLAHTALTADVTVPMLRALGDRMDEAGINSVPFRRDVQRHYPGEFLANYSLAEDVRGDNPTEAIGYFQAALALRPQSAAASNSLGIALASAGRIDEGIADHQRALELDPSFLLAHYSLGRTLATAGRTEEAIAAYRQAIAGDSTNADAHYYLGLALRTQGELSEATDQMRQAVKLQPDFATAFAELGQICFEQGNFADAQAALQSSLKHLPDDAPQRNKLAEILAKCQELLAERPN